MRNPNEPCRYPHQFFQNSSSSSSPPEIDPSSESGEATDGLPDDSETHLPPESPSKKVELREKDSSNSVDPSPSKDSSSSPSFFEKVHMPLLSFPYRLKKKD